MVSFRAIRRTGGRRIRRALALPKGALVTTREGVWRTGNSIQRLAAAATGLEW